jgi:hypothetical protein
MSPILRVLSRYEESVSSHPRCQRGFLSRVGFCPDHEELNVEWWTRVVSVVNGLD